VLILAIMSILVTKATSATNVIQLLDQNIEALALEDPNNPSSPPDLDGGGYNYGDPAVITCDANQHVFSAQCWKFVTEADSFTGRNCHFICKISGNPADHCSTLWAVLSSGFAYCAEY